MIGGKDRLDKLLEGLINHEITISHVANGDGTLRSTSGKLIKVDGELIVIECHDLYGHKDIYHLNRKACQLYSIVDEGKK